MPRFVRPAWLDVSSDNAASRGTGPRSRDGFLTGRLTLRAADGTVSDTIRLDAGGRYQDGSGRAELAIPQSFAVSIIAADGTETVHAAGAIRGILIRPAS